MNNPFRFFLELMRQPVWIPLWMFFLMLVNMASVAFWSEPLAKVIFITFMVSAALMMGLYARFGFSKICHNRSAVTGDRVPHTTP